MAVEKTVENAEKRKKNENRASHRVPFNCRNPSSVILKTNLQYKNADLQEDIL